ncbi:single-stranded DNA-binding protein [Azospirillum sp. sgz301742]
MNVWTFTGRLGADAELRTTQGGEKLLSMRVANDVGYGDRRTTQWVDCTVWGRRADALAEYLTKGKQVVVSGELSLKEFEKRDGTKGATLAVRVAEIDFFGGQKDEAGGGRREPPRGEAGGAYQRGGYSGPRHDDLDDEIPF